jgi:uncharacterized membrane protein
MTGCVAFLLLVMAASALAIALVTRREVAALRAELARLSGTTPPERAPVVREEAPATQEISAAAADPVPPTAPTPLAAAAPAVPPPPFAHDTQPPPPPPPAARPAPARRAWAVDWESLVGVRLFSAIAGIALVLAAVYLFRYSIEHGWLRPAVRAAMGLVTGIALLVVCELRVARNYRATANAMHGAGTAILYATLFAMYSRWSLVGGTTAFVGMVIVTAAAVILSTRRDSVFIALLGLVGGFATPALLSTGENRPLALFSYLLLLNGGISWIAWRKRWPLLTALSVALTVIYQWSWIERFLTAAQLPLAAAIFLVFAAAAMAIGMPRQDGSGAFRGIAAAGSLLPLLFAFFTAIVPEYGAQYHVLFGFLFLMAAGLAAIAAWRGPEWLHLAGGAATLLTFFVWLTVSYVPASWPSSLLWLGAFVALYLLAGLRLDGVAVYTAPLLLFVLTGLAQLEEGSWELRIVALFVLLAAITAYAIRRSRPGPLHVAAVLAPVALLASGDMPGTARLAAIAAVGATGAIAAYASRALLPAVTTALLAGEIAVAIATVGSTAFPFLPLVATHLVLLGGLLLVSRLAAVPLLAPVAAGLAAAALGTAEPLETVQRLAFAWLVHALFVIDTAIPRRGAARSIAPAIAATLSSIVVFIASYDALDSLGADRFLGLLPLTIAAIAGVLLRLNLTSDAGESAEDRQTRLATARLLGIVVLSFVTLAVPVQFEKEWITIGFAVEVVVLAALHRQTRVRGLLYWTCGLATLVFVRLVLNPAVLTYHPRGGVPVLNWFLWTYLFCSAALAFAQQLFPDSARTMRRSLVAAATLQLFVLLNLEIADYYSTGTRIRFDLFDASLARGLTYTIGWAVFAIALLVAGIVFASRLARMSALALLLVTILKCFLHDLGSLAGLYRVASLFGLAVSLVAVGLLLQRFVILRATDGARPPAGEAGPAA